MPAVNLTMSTLAKRFKRPPDFFLRLTNRKRLEEEYGFPPPLLGFDRPVWSIRAIEAWENTQAPNALKASLRGLAAEPEEETLADWEAREDEIVAAMGVARYNAAGKKLKSLTLDILKG